MAERYFNREEAEELLPSVRGWLEQARERKSVTDRLDKELAQAAAQIMVLGGSIPPYAELGRKKTAREQAEAKMVEAINKIHETGCLVKDLDVGLIDFPSLLKGEEIYLCWKMGEPRVGYWHGIHEGFAGRKPLDEPSSNELPPNRPRVQ